MAGEIIVEETTEGWMVKRVDVSPEHQRKGIATKTYIDLQRQAEEAGTILRSDKADKINVESKGLWGKLVSTGLATKKDDGTYEMIRQKPAEEPIKIGQSIDEAFKPYEAEDVLDVVKETVGPLKRLIPQKIGDWTLEKVMAIGGNWRISYIRGDKEKGYSGNSFPIDAEQIIGKTDQEILAAIKERAEKNGLKFPEEPPAEEPVEAPTEYRYTMRARPFDIGTYPKEGFLRYEPEGGKFGTVVYDRKMPIKEFKKWEFIPETELQEAVKTEYTNEYHERIVPERKGEVVTVKMYEKAADTEPVDEMDLTSADFLTYVQTGYFKPRVEAAKPPAKPPVIDEKAREAKHDTLLSRVLQNNDLPKAHTRKAAALYQLIGKAVTDLGYTIGMKGKDMVVTDAQGKEIQMTPDRTPKEVIEAHPLLTEYEDPDFVEFVNRIIEAPESLISYDVPMKADEIKSAIKNIKAEKKTVAANKLLDALEESLADGFIILKKTKNTPRVEIPIEEFNRLITDDAMNKFTNKFGELSPDNVNEAVNMGLMTEEEKDQYLKNIEDEIKEEEAGPKPGEERPVGIEGEGAVEGAVNVEDEAGQYEVVLGSEEKKVGNRIQPAPITGAKPKKMWNICIRQ